MTIKHSTDSSKVRPIIYTMKTIMLSFKTSLGLHPNGSSAAALTVFLYPHTAVTTHIYLLHIYLNSEKSHKRCSFFSKNRSKHPCGSSGELCQSWCICNWLSRAYQHYFHRATGGMGLRKSKLCCTETGGLLLNWLRVQKPTWTFIFVWFVFM